MRDLLTILENTVLALSVLSMVAFSVFSICAIVH